MKLKIKLPKNIVKKNFWRIVSVVLSLALLVTLSQKGCLTGMSVYPVKKIAEDTVEYINDYLLQGQKAELLDYGERNGVVWIKIRIGGRIYDSYVSRDGKLLFPSAISLEEKPSLQAGETQEGDRCEQMPKKGKPVLRAFVVSYCPFGLQMMRILHKIVQEIPELKEYIEVRYIGHIVDGNVTSMHGEKEAMENLREICIREEQREKFWDYIGCFIKSGDTEGCLKEVGVDESKLKACMSDDQRGIKYAEEDFSLNRKFGISASPTLVLNDQEVSEFDFGGRTAEAVKTLLCCGFSKMPDFCSKQLSTEEAARGFSETYSMGTSGSRGRC